MKTNNLYNLAIFILIFLYAIVLFFSYENSQTAVISSVIFIVILLLIPIEKNKKNINKLQTIINTLDEIIIVKTNNKIDIVNDAFLKFFGVSNLKEFKSKFNCINTFFIHENGYLHLDLKNNLHKVVKKLASIPKEKRLVQLKNSKDEIHILTIKIDKLKDEENSFIITLTDITNIQQKAEQLKKEANSDLLTGTYTRRRFNELYQFEFARSIRYINPLSILFIDIDHFKNVNDTFGHDIGDEVLKDFANLIVKNIREFDKLGRWGGEEFILMLPQTTINDAYKLAEKLRKIIKEYKFKEVGTITCSIGISMLTKGDTPEILIKRADIGLYKAKNSGRDKTIIEI